MNYTPELILAVFCLGSLIALLVVQWVKYRKQVKLDQATDRLLRTGMRSLFRGGK